MAISNAVGTERASRVVGYALEKGNFQENTPNLPMSIAIFGQANTDKQAGLGADPDPVAVTSAEEAGELFGFGSQIHSVMRILRSRVGDVIGGIPTVIFPQPEATGASEQIDLLTITGGPASAAGVHIVEINGRSNYDGATLEIPVAQGDTVTDVAAKIRDAINNALSAPVSATAAAGVVTITTKWKGENAAELDIAVDVQGNDLGLAYAVTEDTAAAGDSSTQIQNSLDKFGDEWRTIVINSYGKARIGLFETFNGIAGQGAASTGRYAPTIFKPFVALFGDKTADTVANVITGLTETQTTGVQCPAPNSKGWNHEAAANYCVLLARQAQDSPHLDVTAQNGALLPDMPVPKNNDIGVYATYNNRDAILKGGGSTVTLESGQFRVQDFATTYHPAGEIPPQFRYVRSLIQDWNVRFSYFLLEQINVVDKAIVADNQVVNVSGTIKPSQWRGIVRTMFLRLQERALIVDTDFSNDSLQVGTNDTFPDRFETFFRYKRSPFARIAATTAEAGFAFGI